MSTGQCEKKSQIAITLDDLEKEVCVLKTVVERLQGMTCPFTTTPLPGGVQATDKPPVRVMSPFALTLNKLTGEITSARRAIEDVCNRID